MTPLYVSGTGMWSPGYPSTLDWCKGEPSDACTRPDARLLEGALRRRATPLTRMAVEALDQAAMMAGTDASALPTVFATVHGEHSMAIALLGMMNRGEGKLSPTRFHNSVHNTAGGYASIATGNEQVSTTLTGGGEVVASALIEAAGILAERRGRVGLVLADEVLQPPFHRADLGQPLALACILSADPRNAIASIADIRRAVVEPAPTTDRFGRLHIASALPLFEHVTRAIAAVVPLEHGADARGEVWCAAVEPAS